MKNNKDDKVKKIIISIIVIVSYVLFGILSFPKGNAEFNQLYYFLIGICFIIIIYLIYRKNLNSELKLFKNNIIKNIIYCFGFFLLSFVVVTLGNFLKDMIFGWVQMSSYELVYPNISRYPFYVFFVMVIYTPFVESIIFSKVIHDIFKNKYLFYLISSVFYGILQVGINLNNVPAIISIIPYMLFMLLVNRVYVKKQNIYFPMLIWFLYSGFQFFVQSTAVLGWK